MKLKDKTKKRLTLAGLGILSIVLVVAIAAQFRTGTPTDVKADASSAASDASVPSISAPEATGSSTDQSIQAQVAKPSEPSTEAKTNPQQTPDGKKAAGSSAEPSTPKSGDKNSKGQVWVPGFGWVDNSGDNVGNKAGDMYENSNKIGNMS